MVHTGALACVLAIAAQPALGETGADWSKARRVALVTVEYSFLPNHLIFRRPDLSASRRKRLLKADRQQPFQRA
jgi:hypothetical protein